MSLFWEHLRRIPSTHCHTAPLTGVHSSYCWHHCGEMPTLTKAERRSPFKARVARCVCQAALKTSASGGPHWRSPTVGPGSRNTVLAQSIQQLVSTQSHIYALFTLLNHCVSELYRTYRLEHVGYRHQSERMHVCPWALLSFIEFYYFLNGLKDMYNCIYTLQIHAEY